MLSELQADHCEPMDVRDGAGHPLAVRVVSG